MAKIHKLGKGSTIRSFAKKIRNGNEKPIPEWKMEDFVDNCYLFDDGRIYYFVQTLNDFDDCVPDPDDREEFRKGLAQLSEMFNVKPRDIFTRKDGYINISMVYYDAYGGFDPGSDFENGPEFLMHYNETVRNYCDRNLGGILPVLKLPLELWDALEEGDEETFNEFRRQFPELSDF